MRNEDDGCLFVLFCSSDTVNLIEKVPRDYLDIVDRPCKDKVGVVSVGENSCLDVLFCEELGQAISKPDGPIIGLPRLQPVAAQSMNRDNTRAESDQYHNIRPVLGRMRPIILTPHAGRWPQISQAVADVLSEEMGGAQDLLLLHIHEVAMG